MCDGWNYCEMRGKAQAKMKMKPVTFFKVNWRKEGNPQTREV